MLQDHVQIILDHGALNLGIRNSSGRDAAGIAATHGRESLIPRLRARFDDQQQGPKASTLGRRRRREQRHIRLGNHRARNSIYPDVPSSCYQVASKGAFGAAGAPGVILCKRIIDDEHADEEISPPGGQQQVDSERKSSVRVGGATSHLSESCDVHPSPGETMAVAVQTDPERVCARDATAPSTVPSKAQHTRGCQTPGALSPMPLVGSTDNARLQRRSTAPGDMLSHSLGAWHSALPSTKSGEFGRRKLPNTWESVHNTDPFASTSLHRKMMEQRRPEASTADENLAGSISGSAFSSELHRKGPETPPTAKVDEREPSPCDNGGETGNPVVRGQGDFVLRQQGTPRPGGGSSADSGDDSSPPGAVDPLLEKRNAVDEVTRQLQDILREDALQDDGGCNAHTHDRRCR